MSIVVETVEDRIQHPILTALDNIITPIIKSAFRSMNASSGRHFAIVTASSEVNVAKK